MIKAGIIFCFMAMSLATFSQTKPDTLTNEKVINMVKNGITDLLVKKSITTTKYWNFNLSSDGIINLKKNKVSDSIIVAMFDKNSLIDPVNYTVESKNKSSNPLPTTTSKTLADLSPGIYYESTINNIEYLRLNSTKPALGYRNDPIVGLTQKREFAFLGLNALLRIKNSAPIFYLIIGTGYDNILYQPTQFIVVHAVQKKDNRIVSGKSGGSAKNFFQLNPKDIITPTFTRVNDNLYKITFEKKFPTGNYFFGPTSTTSDLNFLEFDIIK